MNTRAENNARTLAGSNNDNEKGNSNNSDDDENDVNNSDDNKDHIKNVIRCRR